MGSHSVTCRDFPAYPVEAVTRLAIPEECKAELTWAVIISQDSLPVTYLRNNWAVS